MNIVILHRYPYSEIKGTNPSFPYFLEELLDKGNNIYLVTFRENKQTCGSGIKQYPLFKYYPLFLKFNRTNNLDKWLKSILFIILTPLKILSLKFSFKIDLVYCDDSLPFYAYLTKMITKLPTIMRLGDLQTAYVFHNDSTFSRMIYKILNYLEVYTWKKMDKIITISGSFKNFLKNNGIISEKVSIVEESIDIDNFHKEFNGNIVREKFNLGNAPVAMFHGLISKIKGVDILLKSVPYVLKEFPDFKIIIVGDGPYLKKLKRLSIELNISHSVIFTGWVSLDDIPYYIASCDIGIPIRNINLGNNFVVTTAFLQYSILKKPVVVSDLEAFKATLEYNPEQLIFSLNEPVSLSKSIIFLLRNKEKSKLIAENNFKMVQERYDAKKIAKELAYSICN